MIMADMTLYIADTYAHKELYLAQSIALLLDPLALIDLIFGVVNNVPSVPVIHYRINHANLSISRLLMMGRFMKEHVFHKSKTNNHIGLNSCAAPTKHIWLSELNDRFVSDNVQSPARHQVISGSNASLSFIVHVEKIHEFLTKIDLFSWKKIIWKYRLQDGGNFLELHVSKMLQYHYGTYFISYGRKAVEGMFSYYRTHKSKIVLNDKLPYITIKT